jgi:MoaA/NifB/PqqE/SkfB family radical SAM enzyme
LSVYGPDAETHDGITQVPGSFDLTVRAVKLLLERKVRCLIKTPIMRENIHQIEALRQLAADLGISFQYDLTIVPKHTGDLSPLKHRPTDDQLLGFLQERVSPESWHLYPQNDDFRFCSIGMNSMDIGPYGDFHLYRGPCIGWERAPGVVSQNLDRVAGLGRDNKP